MIKVDADPSARTLRQFALTADVVLVGMGAVAYLRGKTGAAVMLPIALAVGIALAGALRPLILRLPFVLLSMLVYPIGIVVSHVILAVLFYGVITPLGLLAQLMRSDPLSERRDPEAKSYWQKRPPPRDKASYLRQA